MTNGENGVRFDKQCSVWGLKKWNIDSSNKFMITNIKFEKKVLAKPVQTMQLYTQGYHLGNRAKTTEPYL